MRGMAKGKEKQNRLVIAGKLPGLNEYIEASRGNRYKAAKMKKDAETRIIQAIRSQLHGTRFENPVVMRYTWYEPNRKRDKDNITLGRKFIQDALVRSRVLKNDGWNEIEGFTDAFSVDKGKPRVEVLFEEVLK